MPSQQPKSTQRNWVRVRLSLRAVAHQLSHMPFAEQRPDGARLVSMRRISKHVGLLGAAAKRGDVGIGVGW